MVNCARDILSQQILSVDAAATLNETLARTRELQASHVAIVADERCLGVSSLNSVDLSRGNQAFGELVKGRPCTAVSSATSLKLLGRLFADSNVEAVVVNNELGKFVGVVTRQSLLEALLGDREKSPARITSQESQTANSLLAGEHEFLESILTAAAHDGGLTKLVEVIESISDGMVCAILLTDEDGLRLRRGAAVSLPEEYVQAVDGLEIGPNAGCCGTAAFRNQPVIVADIASDPLWANFRDVAMKHGLRSCWSVPIRSSSRTVLGTFAMYYGEPRSPDSYHENLIDRAAQLAAIAIERKKSEDTLIRNERQMRQAQQIAHVGSFELAGDGSPNYWSEECFRIVGLEPGGEMPSREQFLHEIIHPDDLELSQEAVWPSLNQSGSFNYEYRIRRPDSSIRWVHAQGKSNTDATGKIVSVTGTLQDITDSRLAASSAHELSIALSNAMPGISKLDINGRYEEVNDHYAHALGFEPHELIGCDWSPTVHPDDIPIAIQAYEDLRRDGKGEFEARAVRKDGSFFHKRALMVRIDDSHGVMTGHHCFVRDITERVTAEEELRAGHNLLTSVLEGTADAVFVKDLKGRYLMVNSAGAQVLGRPAREIIGKDDTQMFSVEIGRSLQRADRHVMDSGELLTVEETAPSSDHEEPRTFLTTKAPYRDHEGQISGIIGIAHDITDRKRDEEALRDSETRIRTLLEGSPICTKIIDLDSRLQYMSTAGQRQLKIPDIAQFYGSTFPPNLYPESWRAVVSEHLERAKTGETSSLDCPVFDTDGREVWFDTTFVPARDTQGSIKYVIVTSVDITKRKQMEEEARKYRDELAHVSRISTIGEMATGVAHELNQPLAAIASYCYVAKSIAERSDSGSDELQDALGKLEDQTIRAGDIVRRLRSFVTKNDTTRVQTDLCTLIQNVATFVNPDIRQAETELEFHFDKPALQIFVDEIQIQQVLVNLIRNAIDAMHETPMEQRKVTVSTEILQDDRVQVSVHDTGKGLPPDVMDLFFNAFFSTKQEGMGMGLAISRSIVEAHSGKLWATPNSGPGSTFGFTIPYEAEVLETKTDSRPRIFVVDDETVVRDSLHALLLALGYSAECFSSAGEFMAFFEPHEITGPTCLIADVQMPEIGGIELLERLIASGRELPAILTTGHGTESLKQKAAKLGAVFLEKPFRPTQLQDLIAKSLEETAGRKGAA